MNRATFYDERKEICKGDEKAAHFLMVWDDLLEAVDDTVDEQTNPELKIRTAQRFLEAYTHPFFLEHVQELRVLVALINNAYADSEDCAQSKLPWKKELWDVLRHSSGEMTRAVALICGGYDHLRSISMKLHEGCHYKHHQPDGTPE